MQEKLSLSELWSVTLPSALDFATNLKYDSATQGVIILHQCNEVDFISHYQLIHQYLQRPQQNQKYCKLLFQTNVYDAISIGALTLVTNKNMPLRIYHNPTLHIDKQPRASISDKRPNCQSYSTAIQLASKGNTIVGGGKKFISVYDLGKLSLGRRIKNMNKRYVSSIELLSESVAVYGQFNGGLSLLDLRTDKDITTFKPHVDLVTRIKPLHFDQSKFVSLARKDNYSYLWDMRNLSSFCQVYEQPLYGNQRTGMEVAFDDRFIFFGGQSGQIKAYQLQTGQMICSYQKGSQCVSSIVQIDNKLLYSQGSRIFPLHQQIHNSGSISMLQVSAK